MAEKTEAASKQSSKGGGRTQAADGARAKAKWPQGTRRTSGAEAENPRWSGSGTELKTPVRPVAKAFSILRYLSDGRSATVAQMARDLQINASTCYNILRTLVAENILNFEDAGKTYKRGAGLLGLTAGMTSQEGRIMFARERLAEFASEYNATICLWERVSLDRNVLVATEHGSGNVRIYLQVSDRFPVLLGSTGRLLGTRLGLSKAEVRRRYSETRWFDKPPFEDYWAQSVKAAEDGYAVDDGNFSAGVLTVSVPVIDSAGNINFSLTALTFRELCRGPAVKKLTKSLKDLADEVAQILY